MEKHGKIILDLCGGSGAWSDPYKKAGYDVRLISLPGQDVRTYRPPAGVYGALAAPPCTQFSFARTRAKTPRDFREGMEIVRACLEIIWECRAEGSLKFWALENPKGYLRQFLGKPAFTFQPYEFGNFWQKPTDLWGRFNAPEKIFHRHDCEMLIQKEWEKRFPQSKNRAALRAVTPSGFARSFFLANQ